MVTCLDGHQMARQERAGAALAGAAWGSFVAGCFFWGVIVSMWVGNLMLHVLNLPLPGIWVRVLSVPNRLPYLAILLFCCVGIYAVNNTFDVGLTPLLGLLEVRFRASGL